MLILPLVVVCLFQCMFRDTDPPHQSSAQRHSAMAFRTANVRALLDDLMGMNRDGDMKEFEVKVSAVEEKEARQ
jgi:hypothetical protein